MTSTVFNIALRFLKLAAASAVVVLGWAVLDPRLFSGTHAGRELQNALAALDRTGPVGRPEWAVVVIALGVALVLAALPKDVADGSRRKVATSGPPPEHAPPLEDAPIPELVGDVGGSMQPVAHAEPVSHGVSVAEARAQLAVTETVADRSLLADLLKKSGDLEEAEGRLGDAVSAYEESVALRREVVAADPVSGREQRWLWMTLEALADSREARGQRTRAAALYREALEAGDRAVALNPEDEALGAQLAATRQELQRLDTLLAV